ncbi:Alpha/beta hydrolase [Rhodanobacter sp. Root179]|nr:alpha/beta hydrolase [Rhodanobacter sp. Root179]
MTHAAVKRTPLKRALIAAACLCLFSAAGAAMPKVTVQTFLFKSVDGQTTEAIHGSLQVPENRSDPHSRMLTLRYVRFPATTNKPGAPIVYLAGGPGGSGIETAKHRRFPLFMAMRQFGDVIALDQRGTGASDDTPVCEPSKTPPESEALTDQAFAAAYRAAAVECAAFWKARGIDLRGYNTNESVRDLDALRRHLGAGKITLWGISYGTHLALAALKQMSPRLDRVVIASAEGLDQTVKLPARTDAYFDRLQAAVDTNPEARAAYPDIKALIARVHGALQSRPIMLHLKDASGRDTDVLLQRRTLQMIEAGAISDPEGAQQMLAVYRAADVGDYQPIAGIVQKYFSPGAPLKMQAMPLAMDVASGIDDRRLALVERQASTALLGDLLNFPMPQLSGVFPQLDLGDAFRKAPVSHVPTLLLSGTLDGRTYPESHREATAGLDHLQTITVVNAGHNLFMATPEVTAAIERFMRGEPAASTRIVAPLPAFAPAPPAPPAPPKA